MVTLVRRERSAAPTWPVLDPSQQSVLTADVPFLKVLGAPGTGKTTTAIELVADRVGHGSRPDNVLLLASSRHNAARLRESVTTRIAGTGAAPRKQKSRHTEIAK